MTTLVKNKWKKPERIFFVFALFFGMFYALFQPLFIEPDSSYHFDTSMYLSNTVVDRASVGFEGEDFQSSPLPFTKVSDMIANDTYFTEFFVKKLPLLPKTHVDKRVSQWYGTEKDLTWYKDIMHIVPALGVKLGYKIYPSIGSMILTARIIHLFVFLLCMFFIIKYTKAYSYIFMAISITPVIIQHATSLSYDTYNYIAFSFMFMSVLNIAVSLNQKKKISYLNAFVQLLFPCVALFFSKMNSKLLYLLIPFLFLAIFLQKRERVISKQQYFFAFFSSLLIGVLVFYYKYATQSHMILKKIVYSLIEPYYTVLSTEILSGTSTASVPYWFYGLQFGVLLLLFLSYEKEFVPKWFSLLSLSIVLLNFLAVMIYFAIDPSFVDYAGRVITGPQGRYFTPFLLLLAPIATLLAKKISVQSGPWLVRLVLLMSALALILTLGIICIRAYHLHLPADEWRSGIHHYIFK